MPVLDFKGKSVIYSHHLRVPFRSLKMDEKKSFLSPSKNGKKSKTSLDDNLIIHGDNLHALKALLPRYSGKVKCIYIDPPYNTGNEGWKYNDRVNSPVMKEWLKQNGIGTDDLERHDKWLCMMWPRLQLLKELLSDDGVIFISIDENEEHNLRIIMEEIFGESKFIEKIVWNKRVPKNDKGIGSIHEYILLFSKNNGFKHKFKIAKDGISEVLAFVENLKKRKTSIHESEQKLKQFYESKGYDRGITLYSNLDNDYKLWGKINVSWPNAKHGPRYDVLHPSTGKPCKVPDNGWRWKKETFKKYVDYNNCNQRHDGSYVCGRIWFGKNEKLQPSFIQYFEDVKNFLLRSIISIKSSGGMELDEIIPDQPFKHPKTPFLIKKLFASINSSNFVVLDSFAGSGTTAQAILDLNKEDGGNRKFILVECEDYADEITAERVRRVIKGVPNAKEENLKKGLGGSFTYCTLGEEINTENLIRGKSLPDYKQLAEYVFYTATGKSLDKVAKPNAAWFIGETEVYRFHLVYKPNLAFLKSKDSALNLDMAETIKKFNSSEKMDSDLSLDSKEQIKTNPLLKKQRVSRKISLVFAPAKYMTQKELKKDYNIQFCQLPYAIHKIMGA